MGERLECDTRFRVVRQKHRPIWQMGRGQASSGSVAYRSPQGAPVRQGQTHVYIRRHAIRRHSRSVQLIAGWYSDNVLAIASGWAEFTYSDAITTDFALAPYLIVYSRKSAQCRHLRHHIPVPQSRQHLQSDGALWHEGVGCRDDS